MICFVIQSGLHPRNEHYRVGMFQRGIERAMGCPGGLAQLPR
jgi:hypothetical protein